MICSITLSGSWGPMFTCQINSMGWICIEDFSVKSVQSGLHVPPFWNLIGEEAWDKSTLPFSFFSFLGNFLRSQFFCVLCQREKNLDMPAELTLFWLLLKKHCFAHTLSLSMFQLKQHICINSLQNRPYVFRVFRFQASEERREAHVQGLPPSRVSGATLLALARFPLLAWKTRKITPVMQASS